MEKPSDLFSYATTLTSCCASVTGSFPRRNAYASVTTPLDRMSATSWSAMPELAFARMAKPSQRIGAATSKRIEIVPLSFAGVPGGGSHGGSHDRTMAGVTASDTSDAAHDGDGDVACDEAADWLDVGSAIVGNALRRRSNSQHWQDPQR